jgi:hypothetical protein
MINGSKEFFGDDITGGDDIAPTFGSPSYFIL